MRAISESLRPLVEEQSRCLVEEVLPVLAGHGVVVRSYRDLTREERAAADRYFDERVFPVLTPQAVDPGHPFDLSLNIGVMVEPRREGSEDDVAATVKTGRRFARVKIPPVVPHLVPVGEAGRKFVFVGSLISANVGALFPEMRTGKCHLFRVTPRNLDRRVETLAPVRSDELKGYLKGVVLDAYLRDNVKAREPKSDGSYGRVGAAEGEGRLNCQEYFQTAG